MHVSILQLFFKMFVLPEAKSAVINLSIFSFIFVGQPFILKLWLHSTVHLKREPLNDFHLSSRQIIYSWSNLNLKSFYAQLKMRTSSKQPLVLKSSRTVRFHQCIHSLQSCSFSSDTVSIIIGKSVG